MKRTVAAESGAFSPELPVLVAAFLVAAAEDLEEEVGVPVVVGQVPDLVDHDQAGSVQ
jgi:hypothetical protein